MQIASGALFKDVTHQDFDHYFKGTGMYLKLPTDKKRLYVVEGVTGDGEISGSYLTQGLEWKEKNVSFTKWFENLDVIVPQTLYFNVGNSAGSWQPSLTKNLKKSFPYSTSAVKMYGAPTAEESTEQMVSSVAFEDAGHTAVSRPDAEYALNSHTRTATCTPGDFIFDLYSRQVFFKKLRIGKISRSGGRELIELDSSRAIFSDLLVSDAGLHSSRITVSSQKQEPTTVKQSSFYSNNHWGSGVPNNWTSAFNVNAFQTVGINNIGDQIQFDVPPTPPELTAQPVLVNWNMYPRLTTVSPLPPGTNNIEGIDTVAPLPHTTRTVNGRPVHRMTPPGSSDRGWRLDIYYQVAVNIVNWAMPKWGRGYALVRADGRISTYRGLPPTHMHPSFRPYCSWTFPGATP